MALADRITGVESGGDPRARNPRSSAYGAGQFLEQTWLDVLARHRPELTTGRSREEILGLRADPALSKAMTDAYAADNSKVLTGAGLPVTPGTSYLAHFAGPQGAVNLMKADPSAPAGSVLGEEALKANPFLANMTVSDLRAWADGKMGQPAAQGAPMNILPDVARATPQATPDATQQATPLFGSLGAPQAGNALMQLAMGSMGSSSNDSASKPPPLPPPIRRQPIDMSRLLAALARPQSRAFS